MVRRAVAALIVAALGSGVSADAAPASNADVRLVATARPGIMVGELLTVRTTWTARRRVALVVGAEWIEVDAGRGFEPHAEAGFSETCPVSVPVSYAAGRSTATEHRVGLERREAAAHLSGLEAANASIGFVFSRPGRYRIRVRYEDATSNVVEVEAVAPTGRDADVLAAVRARPIVLTFFAGVEPAIRDEGAALIRRYGSHPLLRPYLRAIGDVGGGR
jgi:hypothetical protein